MDPTYGGCAEYSSHVYNPDSPRKHGNRRRRSECAQRRIQCSRQYRSRPLVPHPTRLSGRADSVVGNVGGFQRGKDAKIDRATKCKLVAEFSQVFGEPAQVVLGDKATKENDFGYGWLPKLDEGQNCSWLNLFDQMYAGTIKGFFSWGQNPACSGANANKVRQALAKLDWLVNVNIFDNETGSFWKGPGMDPKSIKTEVFMLPCAAPQLRRRGASATAADGLSCVIELSNLQARPNRMVTLRSS